MSDDKERLPGDGSTSSPEKRADDIMRSILTLNRAEIADVYRSQTQDDPTQKLYHIAAMAATAYQARGEALPGHVISMLSAARQRNLELEGLTLECTIPKILLVDADPERMISRRSIFEAHQYRVEIAFTLTEALERLNAENFQAVIVEWSPGSPEDLNVLHELQTWNLQIPVMNVSAWVRLAHQAERRFNWNLVRALAKMFGRPMPRNVNCRSANRLLQIRKPRRTTFSVSWDRRADDGSSPAPVPWSHRPYAGYFARSKALWPHHR